MLLVRLDQAARYAALHPGLADAFRFLRTTDLAALAPGRVELSPDRLYANIDRAEGRGRAGAALEIHRRFIDVQYTLAGMEEIGWRDLASCAEPEGAFDAGRDIGFFRDAPLSWIAAPPGYLAVFFPDDAHAPLAGTGPLRKVVMKVAVA